MTQDSHLQQAVLAELRWEPSVTAAHIGVAAHDGVVTLSGHVESYAEKQAAEAAARRVKGVKAVAEEIEVHLPHDTRRGDEEIARAAADRLSWNVSVPSGVVASVEKAWVTLLGEVEWNYEREAAERDMHGLLGVVGVTNRISIRPRVNAEILSDDIMHALHRSWFFDPKTIEVSVEGGKVTLTGSVTRPVDRRIAAATAWAAPGVTEVENRIVVE